MKGGLSCNHSKILITFHGINVRPKNLVANMVRVFGTHNMLAAIKFGNSKLL